MGSIAHLRVTRGANPHQLLQHLSIHVEGKVSVFSRSAQMIYLLFLHIIEKKALSLHETHLGETYRENLKQHNITQRLQAPHLNEKHRTTAIHTAVVCPHHRTACGDARIYRGALHHGSRHFQQHGVLRPQG